MRKSVSEWVKHFNKLCEEFVQQKLCEDKRKRVLSK